MEKSQRGIVRFASIGLQNCLKTNGGGGYPAHSLGRGSYHPMLSSKGNTRLSTLGQTPAAVALCVDTPGQISAAHLWLTGDNIGEEGNLLREQGAEGSARVCSAPWSPRDVPPTPQDLGKCPP